MSQPFPLVLTAVGCACVCVTVLALSAAPVAVPAPDTPAPETIVARIVRADCEGDRAALAVLRDALTVPGGDGVKAFVPPEASQVLRDALTVPGGDPHLASRVRYWRGFAMWRRAINGFNDATPPAELEQDLTRDPAGTTTWRGSR